MKDVVEVSFTVNVKAAPVAKSLSEPFTKILNKSIPYLERLADAVVKEQEAESEETVRKTTK